MVSLTGALFTTVIYGISSSFDELALIPMGFFAVLAFGAALGIARWALYDLVSAINALR